MQPYEWIQLFLGVVLVILGIYAIFHAVRDHQRSSDQDPASRSAQTKLRNWGTIFLGLAVISFAITDGSGRSLWGWIGALFVLIAIVLLLGGFFQRNKRNK